MEDAPRLLGIPKSEYPRDLDTPSATNEQNYGLMNVEELVVLPERNLYGHTLAVLLWETQFEELMTELGWERVLNWECLFVHRKPGLYLSETVDDINMIGEKQHMSPMWKKLMINVHLDETTTLLDHGILGCTQRDCKLNEFVIEEYREMFESRISSGADEKFPGWENPHERRWRVPTTWKDMLKNAMRDCELANNKEEQIYSFLVFDWMITSSRRKILKRLEGYQKFAHKLLEMLVLGTNW